VVSYTLDNAEELHAEFPDTFWIPGAAQRRTLLPGQIVKLVFRISVGEEVHVERMWVGVASTGPSGYIGRLDNDPYCTAELKAGEEVRFGPEHVIQIHEDTPNA
jgi:hypothetical protein